MGLSKSFFSDSPKQTTPLIIEKMRKNYLFLNEIISVVSPECA
jgi:hypothetical protein